MMAARRRRLTLRPCWRDRFQAPRMPSSLRFASLRVVGSAALVSAALFSAGIGPAIRPLQAAEALPAEQERPAGLVLLEVKQRLDGQSVFGIVAASADAAEAGLWRVKVWDEVPGLARIRNETVRCQVDNPMRITNDGNRQLVRFLNPGGAVTPANRRDHLVWWAVCFPEQAGRDPAQLGPTARSLGFRGLVVERELELPSSLR